MFSKRDACGNEACYACSEPEHKSGPRDRTWAGTRGPVPSPRVSPQPQLSLPDEPVNPASRRGNSPLWMQTAQSPIPDRTEMTATWPRAVTRGDLKRVQIKLFANCKLAMLKTSLDWAQLLPSGVPSLWFEAGDTSHYTRCPLELWAAGGTGASTGRSLLSGSRSAGRAPGRGKGNSDRRWKGVHKSTKEP